MKTLTTVAFSTLLLAGAARAQDENNAQKKRKPTRAMKLAAVCARMSKLDSVSYAAEHETTNRVSMIVMQGGGKFEGVAIKSKGVMHKDLLAVDVGDADHLVFRGRRMIAADDDNDWVVRRAKTASGDELFFALDPTSLFSTLASMKLEVSNQSVGTVENRPVEIYTVRVEGADARTLLWSGAIPRDDGKTGGRANRNAGAIAIRAFGALGMQNKKPKVQVDLALAFDPGTKLVHRVWGRSFIESPVRGGRGRILINGVNVNQQNDDEADEEDKTKVGEIEDGLPIPSRAKVKKSTVVEFDVRFRGHDATDAPKLSTKARKLLGM